MSVHSIKLHLPDPLYDQLKSRAKRARRSLEDEILRIVLQESDIDTARPGPRELSVTDAAALLNVPQAQMVSLLDDGKLAHRKVARTRYVELDDLVAYKQRDLARRREILAELSSEAQDMGLGY